MSVPIDAYMGSRSGTDDRGAEGLSRFAASGADGAGSLILEFLDDAARLLCQTLLLPEAISSIVLPLSTDVMFSR
jgi:hypothetical protein